MAIVNGENVMTAEERKEIIELLVKNGFYRSMLNACDNKVLARKLREFRQEECAK